MYMAFSEKSWLRIIQDWWSMKVSHNDFIHKATSNLCSLCVPYTNIVEASMGQFFTLTWWRTMISSWLNSTCKPATIFEQWTLIQISSNTTQDGTTGDIQWRTTIVPHYPLSEAWFGFSDCLASCFQHSKFLTTSNQHLRTVPCNFTTWRFEDVVGRGWNTWSNYDILSYINSTNWSK